MCKTGFDISLKILLVKSCILSLIDYCNSLYIDHPEVYIKKLQRLMNVCIRFIYNIKLSDNYSITEYMKKCHFLPVKARIEYKIVVLVYKCLHDLAPNYLQNLIKLKTSLPFLRIYNDHLLLYTPKLNAVNYKNRSFSIVAPRIWNQLPLDLRQTSSLVTFQTNLKTHFLSIHFDNK